MNNSVKRFVVAFVLPMIVGIVVCAIIFMKNAFPALEAMLTIEPEDAEVQITKENWDEYFIIGDEIVEIKDENDNLVKLSSVIAITLKDEYKDRVIDEKPNEVYFTGDLHTKKVVYEITDAKAGEWKIIGDSGITNDDIVDFIYGSADHYTISWGTKWTYELEDYKSRTELWHSPDTEEGLAMEIPTEDWKVENASGKLYLEQE